MSDEKQEPRTLEVIGKEYARLAQQYGDGLYRVKVMSEDLESLAVKMKDLNQEAFKLQQESAAQAPKIEAEAGVA